MVFFRFNYNLPIALFAIVVSFTVEITIFLDVVEDDAVLTVVVIVVCSKA